MNKKALNPGEKISTFEILGRFIDQFSSISFSEDSGLGNLNDLFAGETELLIDTTHQYNHWFSPEFIRLRFLALSQTLKKEHLEKWIASYTDLEPVHQPKQVTVIMAGNIPLVGFDDFLAVIMSGNVARIKMSSKDNKLFPLIKKILIHINPDFESLTIIEEGLIKNPDAIIATGSNNSSRYFDYYFRSYPHIIRKNRNSAAVITGSETNLELVKLADDIFSFFGMGCRNVSKVFLPEGFKIPDLLKHFEHYSYLGNHNKYANNYEYHRAIHLINSTFFYDMGFLICKEDKTYSSPVGTIYYEFYSSQENIKQKLENDKELLQCVVATENFYPGTVDFGDSQFPMLWDYADNVDCMKFLINLNRGNGL